MKYILALVLVSIALVSGCTQTGMITGEEGACTLVNNTFVDIYRLDASILGVNKQILLSQDLDYYAEGLVTLQNTDNESGWFLLTFEWMRPGQGMPYTEKKSLHLDPGEAGEFISACPIDPQLGAVFTYSYTSYPDSGRTVKKQIETSVCG